MTKQEPIIEVWITKYALTSGIKKVRVRVCRDINPNMVSDVENTWTSCYHKPDWHESYAEAIARAEQMRLAKIKSLNKQIARLSVLTFSPEPRE